MSQPRKLFEEVSEETPGAREAPHTGLIGKGAGGRGHAAARLWLALLFVMVAAMVVVGGLTRLTDSGLSITEWAPFSGALPPMSDAAWQAEFDRYQEIPEFTLQNSHMDIAAFKSIYWWEWSHRQLGRVIGLVWALGYGALWLSRRIPPGWHARLALPGLLGGVQGAIGWWMVSSGLRGTAVDVASYRLAVHLGLAFVILGLITWYYLSLARDEAARMQARRGREAKLFSMATGVMHLAFLQILLGALVAGIDAGRSFVDWPLMAGQLFPPEAFSISPGWRNFFENPGLVQFVHRVVGYLLVIFALVVTLRARRSPNPATRALFLGLGAMVLVQMTLGILTVINAAPLHIAITHQIGAIATWAVILAARHQAGYPATQSLRG